MKAKSSRMLSDLLGGICTVIKLSGREIIMKLMLQMHKKGIDCYDNVVIEHFLNLSPEEVWELILETKHIGPRGYRMNALELLNFKISSLEKYYEEQSRMMNLPHNLPCPDCIKTSVKIIDIIDDFKDVRARMSKE